MAQNDGPNDKTRLLELFVRALEDHEKEMDHIADNLQTVKAKLSSDIEAVNVRIEKINPKLSYIESQIEQLKKLIRGQS